MKRTRELEEAKHRESIVRQMKNAARKGEFRGFMSAKYLSYLSACTRADYVTGTKLLFTRDTNHHESGWFKNPDYERCLHLSMSPLEVSGLVTASGQPVAIAMDVASQAEWVKEFFKDDLKYVWAESPKSDIGKQMHVWHWRLFCNEHWQAILPRGEVYSKEFTDMGWRSATQVFEEDGIEIVSVLNP